MAKQYSFKTTKTTKWIESILDDLSSGERSEAIREMIADYLEKSGIKDEYEKKYGEITKKESPLTRLFTWVGHSDTKGHTMRNKETPKVVQSHSKEILNVTPFESPPPMEEGIEDTEIDLESKLNNLGF